MVHQAIEQVMSATHKSPSKGWELLQGPSFKSHPDRARLLCRVCWIALSKGMAQQVLFKPVAPGYSALRCCTLAVGYGQAYMHRASVTCSVSVPGVSSRCVPSYKLLVMLCHHRRNIFTPAPFRDIFSRASSPNAAAAACAKYNPQVWLPWE